MERCCSGPKSKEVMVFGRSDWGGGVWPTRWKRCGPAPRGAHQRATRIRSSIRVQRLETGAGPGPINGIDGLRPWLRLPQAPFPLFFSPTNQPPSQPTVVQRKTQASRSYRIVGGRSVPSPLPQAAREPCALVPVCAMQSVWSWHNPGMAGQGWLEPVPVPERRTRPASASWE